MYNIQREQKDGFQLVILSNEANRIEIIPSCGGIMNAWYVRTGDNWQNIISGYDDLSDFTNNCEKKGFRSCKLSPYVCRIKEGKFSLNEQEFAIGKFGFDHHNIHGLLYNVIFDVVESNYGASNSFVRLSHQYEGTDAGFPFSYSIELNYELSGLNELLVETKLINHHKEEIPVCDGWHPYFKLGSLINDCTLKINSEIMLEFDEELIPTGKEILYSKFLNSELINNTFLDNCFVLDPALKGPACTLANEMKNIKIDIFPQLNYPYLQLYTPDDRQSIAIENLSAAPDAFNNQIGLNFIQPDDEKIFSTRYIFSDYNIN